MCENNKKEELFDPNEEDFQEFYNELLEVCKKFYLKQGFHEFKIRRALHLAYPVLAEYMEY